MGHSLISFFKKRVRVAFLLALQNLRRIQTPNENKESVVNRVLSQILHHLLPVVTTCKLKISVDYDIEFLTTFQNIEHCKSVQLLKLQGNEVVTFELRTQEAIESYSPKQTHFWILDHTLITLMIKAA